MNKLRKKHNRYRCLKTISYLLGFPLFIIMILVGSMCLFEGDVFQDIKWYGVIVAVIAWLVTVVVQILISLITKNNNARTAMVLIVSMVLVLGGSVLCDLTLQKKYDEIADKYEQYGVELNTYKYEAGWVNTWTPGKKGVAKQYIDEVEDFLRIYNIEYKSKNYGAYNGNKVDDIANYKAEHEGKKDGMTDADYVLSRIEYDAEADAYYSINGLYADGYVFGYQQALDVLINYHQYKFNIENDKVETPVKNEDGEETGEVIVTYEPNGKNADEELAKALKAVDSNSEWREYKNSDEYKEVYGKGGKAYSYMIDVAKLDKILGALGSGLMESSILGVVGTFVDLDELLSGVGLSKNDIKKLSVDKLLDVVNGLLEGMSADEGLGATLAGMGIDVSEPITEDVLLDLLANFSYYQYPTLKPKFEFIEDEDIKGYALANYYATTHGANIGSVLIGDKIGHVTMSTSGYDGATYGYTLTELYTMKAHGELAEFYPFMLARRYGYICAGLIALMTVLFYHNKKKEDEVFALIANGGR